MGDSEKDAGNQGSEERVVLGAEELGRITKRRSSYPGWDGQDPRQAREQSLGPHSPPLLGRGHF